MKIRANPWQKTKIQPILKFVVERVDLVDGCSSYG